MAQFRCQKTRGKFVLITSILQIQYLTIDLIQILHSNPFKDFTSIFLSITFKLSSKILYSTFQMDKYEQLVVSAKTELSNARVSIYRSPTQWRNFTDTVRACVSNIDTSRIMLGTNRLEERLWFINEVQNFAYFDADSGAITELASWCEREWNRVLDSHPTSVEALKGIFTLDFTYFFPYEIQPDCKRGFSIRCLQLRRSWPSLALKSSILACQDPSRGRVFFRWW